jgi:hypothetical protein
MTFPNSNDNQTGAPTEPAQEQTPAANQPEFITKDQFDQAIGQLSTKMDNWYKGIQSVDGKVQDKIKKLEAAAKAQGVSLTPDQRKLMENKALIDTLDESTNATHPQSFNPGQGQSQGNVDPQLASRVNDAADTIVMLSGIELEDNDPEIKMIDEALTKTPQEYLAAVQKAVDSKKERLKTTPQNDAQTPAPQETFQSPGLVQGVAQSNPIANITDRDELWKRAQSSKRG